MARVMEITTPLGRDVLLFHAMRGREELGRVPEYQVDLLSLKNDIDIDTILGKNVTVTMSLVDDNPRCFNGFVTRFSAGATYGKYRRYHAVIHPWLWFLSRKADCRIFQDMTVPEIVKQVFEEEPANAFKMELTGSYRTRAYCVQYRETTLDFVSRLLEDEGIYYYVTHENGRHTAVLTDSYSGHEPIFGKPLPFIAPEDLARPDIEHVGTWTLSREVQPGVYVHDDYDFERPSVDLLTKKSVLRSYTPSTYEVYDYPGFYAQRFDGEASAEVRIHELAAQFETVQGTTNARKMQVGGLFDLARHAREDQNREHLVVAANYELTFSDYEAVPDRGGADYRCSFVAMSSKEQFRPRRITPKPFVQGPQTAVVVGPGGEEIFTDKYGRVKVQFHWDRRGGKDENSSCWVRVSHPWAGKSWGAVAIPRIGQEVIVDFLEGDPDQPIVTGAVYNAEQMPPYALPANMTQTGIKTRSTKGGGPDNFNEIRFEDKKGEEQLFIHAEKNQDIEVEHDETHWVGHDRKKTIDNDETTHVKGNRTETVDKDETITIHQNRTEAVDKDETITIGGRRTETVAKDETISIGGNRTEHVDGNETITVGKDRTRSVGQSETIDVAKDQTVSVGQNRNLSITKNDTIEVSDSRTERVAKNETITIGKDRKVEVGQNDAVSIAKKYLLDAGDQITIQTGSASITMKKDGTITIKGKDITIDGSGKINIKASKDVIVKGSKIQQN